MLNSIITLVASISIIYIIITLAISILIQYGIYRLWENNTFSTIWFINLILLIIGNLLTIKENFLIFLVIGGISALINTAIESFSYKRANSFIGYILWQFLFALIIVIPLFIIIALIATPITLNNINSAREDAKERSAELVVTNVKYAYQMAQLNNTGLDPTIYQIENYLEKKGMENANISENKITTNDGVLCELEDTASDNNHYLTLNCYKDKNKKENYDRAKIDISNNLKLSTN